MITVTHELERLLVLYHLSSHEPSSIHSNWASHEHNHHHHNHHHPSTPTVIGLLMIIIIITVIRFLCSIVTTILLSNVVTIIERPTPVPPCMDKSLSQSKPKYKPFHGRTTTSSNVSIMEGEPHQCLVIPHH